jgi:uncharacterized protein
MRALLDVNVLIALLDAAHQHHALAWHFFEANIDRGWASTAITQNGYVRIVSQSSYPNRCSVQEAIFRLAQASKTPHHEYWASLPSLLDDACTDHGKISSPAQLTDLTLLQCAIVNGGRLVSFDRSINVAALRQFSSRSLVLL